MSTSLSLPILPSLLSSNLSEMATTTLFCLVHGESITNAFPVKIPQADTVGDLKELIKLKKAPEFDTIAADKLMLWKVNIPTDNATALKELVLENNKEKGIQELLPLDDIAEAIPTPLKRHIHIIIECPLHVGK
jgi:hypothetical protein